MFIFLVGIIGFVSAIVMLYAAIRALRSPSVFDAENWMRLVFRALIVNTVADLILHADRFSS